MIEILSTVLIVIFCVLLFLSQVAGIVTFVLTILRGKRITSLEEKVALLHQAIKDSKTETSNGQFQLAELVTKGITSTNEYHNKICKEIIDSNFDLVTKNTDDVLKMDTSNSQKVYDAVVVMIQMMNNFMTMMGYRPTLSGLKDPERPYGSPATDE